MGINGISAGYYPAGYVNNKTRKAKPNAPDEVRHACKEVKVETNGVVTVYRLCISNDGGQCYITKTMIDRYARWSNGVINPDDMLGDSDSFPISAQALTGQEGNRKYSL